MSAYKLGKDMKKINVLSIDGGGIRGIIPAMVLAEIEKRTGKRICELFDIIAGTSTGGILALALTKPKSPGSKEPAFTASELIELYEKKGPVIFPKKNIFGKIGAVMGAKYRVDGLENLLQDYFGEARLKEALTRVIITSYNIETRTAWFFKSTNAQIPDDRFKPGEETTYDYPMTTVARATSAAPTYFQPAKVKGLDKGKVEEWILIDGGVQANNPAMCAYVEALKLIPDKDMVSVVSLGTGAAPPKDIGEKADKWGLIGWAVPIIQITMDGPGDTVDYQLDKLLRKWDYYRLQTELTNVSDALDNVDASNIKRLKELTQEMITTQNDNIDKACSRLLQNKFYPLSNKEIAEGCKISSQAAANLLRELNLPPELCQELWVGSDRQKCYATEVLEIAKTANKDRGPASQS